MRAFDAALGTPWAMLPEQLETLVSISLRENEISPEALEAYRAQSVSRAETLEQRDGVAVLNVIGPLFRRANLFTEISGATSYEVLRRDLQVVEDDPSLRALLVNVDSPGGDANGVDELTKAIVAVRAKKPVIAYVGGTAASGGYWIASGASEIVASDAALLGSIGVVLTLRDTRGRDQAAGVKTYEFVSSQSPHKRADPATERGAGQLQGVADDLADVFVAAVARNRGRTVEQVLADFGGGGVLVGAKAVAAGMADRLGTFEETLAQLQTRGRSPGRSTRSVKGHSMGEETQPGAKEFDALRADNDKMSAQLTELTTKLADRDRRDAIMALDEAKGREAQAKELADAGVSADAAKKILAAGPKGAAGEEEDEEQPDPVDYARRRAAAAGIAGPGGAPRKPARASINRSEIFAMRAQQKGA